MLSEQEACGAVGRFGDPGTQVAQCIIEGAGVHWGKRWEDSSGKANGDPNSVPSCV